MARALSTTQQRAMNTMDACGKMTTKTASIHGVALKTLDSLVDRGLIEREFVGVVRPQPIYKLKETA